MGKQSDEVVENLKARLYRTRTPWLLVFDNVERAEDLADYMPRGAVQGHVLITSRVHLREFGQSVLTLECFGPAEVSVLNDLCGSLSCWAFISKCLRGICACTRPWRSW